MDDSSAGLVCDGSQTYASSSIPLINALSTDGTYAACALLSDAAGNQTYAKSTQVIRDTVAPTFTSLNGVNAGSDGFVSDSEKAFTTVLWTLVQSGASTIQYTSPLDDTNALVSCDVSKTYGQSTIARAVDLSSDLPWVICVKLSDTAGNVTYGKSSQVIRDISGPSFTSLARANAASDGFISNSEKLLVSALWSLTASGQTATAYTVATVDSAGTLACDVSKSYSQASIATPADLGSDGIYVICVRLSDASGNITYGKSASVTRDTVAPAFTSLARANEASDGYINNSEKTSALSLYTLTASGQSSTQYTLALSDTSSALVCDSSKTYSSGSIPLISSISSDGAYAVCVALTDAAGNISYGKSAQVTRATSAPVFSSLALANAASDGYINNSERLLTTAMWTLTASGQSVTAYTTALSDTGGALVCDAAKTYDQSTIPIPTSLSVDGAFALCVKLSDASGNITYGKSVQVVRDIVLPTFTSLVGANGAADGIVMDSEKASGLALLSLVASNQDSTNYTVPLDDTSGAVVCDSAKTYSASSIPTIASLTPDGTYAVCVKLADFAG
ncbi:MAG: hypothetical protein EOP07_23430, partial [Proteobacteria bacterium]